MFFVNHEGEHSNVGNTVTSILKYKVLQIIFGHLVDLSTFLQLKKFLLTRFGTDISNLTN